MASTSTTVGAVTSTAIGTMPFLIVVNGNAPPTTETAGKRIEQIIMSMRNSVGFNRQVWIWYTDMIRAIVNPYLEVQSCHGKLKYTYKTPFRSILVHRPEERGVAQQDREMLFRLLLAPGNDLNMYDRNLEYANDAGARGVMDLFLDILKFPSNNLTVDHLFDIYDVCAKCPFSKTKRKRPVVVLDGCVCPPPPKVPKFKLELTKERIDRTTPEEQAQLQQDSE